MTYPTVRLKSVASVAISSVDKKSVEGEVPVRLCNYTDVYYSDEIRNDRDFMAATATVDQIVRFRLKVGQTLITKDSETADDIGVPAFVAEAAPDLVCGYHLAQLSPGSQVDGKFLYWTVASAATRDQLSVAASGVTRFGLRTDSIANLHIPLPAIAKQRAIADFLDAETARIDALIAKKIHLAASLKERLTNWISERLHCTEQDGLDRSGPWPWVPLRHVVSVHGGLTLGKTYDGVLVRRPYLRVANVQDGRLELAEVAYVDVPAPVALRHQLRTGDVLMLEGNGSPENLGRGTVWRGEIGGCLHQNHVHAVRPDQKWISEGYLDLVVKSRWARMQFTGSGERVSIATLSQQQVRDLAVPLPPRAEQDAIVREVHTEIHRVATMLSRLDRQIALLHEHRQALITAAVTGELEVSGAA